MDQSWGGTADASLRVRTSSGLEERAHKREQERRVRAQDRAAAMAQRQEARALSRTLEAAAREQARVERRAREEQAASGDPHAAAAKRHRSSGRKDVVREGRDTRAYVTHVDAGRVRELAKRGTSRTGLAGAFGITEDEVARILAGEE